MADRITFILSCADCKNRNYYFSRGKAKPHKVEVKKFCRACGKHTVHRETKSS